MWIFLFSMIVFQLTVCITFFLHSFVDGYFGCLHILSIVNNVPLNKHVGKFEILVSFPLDIYPILNYLTIDSSFIFYFIVQLPYLYPYCINSCFQQQLPFLHVTNFLLLISYQPYDMRWYVVILILVSLLISYIDHLFMYLLAINMYLSQIC